PSRRRVRIGALLYHVGERRVPLSLSGPRAANAFRFADSATGPNRRVALARERTIACVRLRCRSGTVEAARPVRQVASARRSRNSPTSANGVRPLTLSGARGRRGARSPFRRLHGGPEWSRSSLTWADHRERALSLPVAHGRGSACSPLCGLGGAPEWSP